MATSLKTYPTRCSTCATLAEAPLACSDCRSLYEHVRGADHFELFGLDRRYELDPADLHARYLSIARNIHPDAFSNADEVTRQLMLRISAAVNNAYETLRDPILRADYLLELTGGRSAADDKRVPPELLGEVMALREEIDEAVSAGDAGRVGEYRRSIGDRRGDVVRRIEALAGRMDDPAARDELRLQLNSLKYFDNLLAQL